MDPYKHDPKLKKQNQKYLQRCVDILQGVEGYLGERAEEKSSKAILLDDLGSQDLLTSGLPDLATKKLS